MTTVDSCAAPEPPATPDELELLRAHAPLLQYSQEPYRMCSARTITDTPGNALVRADGTRLEAERGLSLDELAPDAGGGEYLDEATETYEDVLPPALQHEPAYANRVHGRVVADGNGGTWLQYWFWIYFNQKRLGGIGAHEGDWEMIQIHLGADGAPDRATFAQHEHQEPRDWKPGDTVELQNRDGRDRLVVFVAPFSHASYFRPGTVFYAGGTDSPDRLGPCELPAVEPFGAWASWPGRWGGTGAPRKLHSPRSPACQGGTKWSDPDAFHTLLPRVKLLHRLGRAVWRIGKRTFPLAPEVDAAIEGDYVHVRYATPTIVRRGSHLYVSAHDPDTRQLVAGPVIERRRRGTGELRLDLKRDVDRCVVHATAYNFLRQTSYPGTTEARRAGAR
jgi:hypothetical protein